jgi:hypothetical protein
MFIYRTVAALLDNLGFLKAKKQLNNIEQLVHAEKDILGKSSMPCNPWYSKGGCISGLYSCQPT